MTILGILSRKDSTKDLEDFINTSYTNTKDRKSTKVYISLL